MNSARRFGRGSRWALTVALSLPSLAVGGQALAQAQLSFISQRSGNRDVYVIGEDGQGERRLTASPADESNGPSTPDGAHILITISDRQPPTQRSAPTEPDAEGRFHFALLSRRATVGGTASALPAATSARIPSRSVLRYPSFFPDGKQLLFESEPTPVTSGLRELFTLRLAPPGQGTLRQLTHNREGNFAPTVCGRSGYIAFTSSRDRASELYRMRLDGSELRRLTYSPGSKWLPRCPDDGQRIFFVSDRDGADRIYFVHRNGSEPRRLSERSLDSAWTEDSPAVTSDGRYVAYVLGHGSQNQRVRIVDLTRRSDCEVPLPPLARGREPDWSPHPGPPGPRLALSVELPGQNAPTSDGSATVETQIFVADSECRRAQQLTRSRGPNWHPLWLR